MVASDPITYDRRELSGILKAFKAMDDQAVQEARTESNALATYAANQIKVTAMGRTVASAGVRRVAEGVRISKSSKIGEFSYGFASQRFSGGATTQKLWAGLEFGSNRYRQFPRRTPNQGRGNSGYFIYPTLRKIQPEFGSNRYSQFPRRTPNRGRGNSGYFIYPTLRKIQPELVRKWEEAFATILKKWG